MSVHKLVRFLGCISLSLAIILHSVGEASTSHVYIVYLGANRLNSSVLASNHHLRLLSRVFTSNEEAEGATLYSYNYGFSGFSAKINSTQAASLAKMKQVITVFKSKTLKLHTTRSWDFLDLTLRNDGGRAPPQLSYGSDVVVGIFDTGIWPESESFKESPEAKPIPPSWNGECVAGESFDPSVHCNRKLIGARFYLRGFQEVYGPINPARDPEYRSPRDFLGHGTHTASTAVGSVASDISGFFGLGGGTARGGAPEARLAVYKTCWAKDLEGVCTEADILAAFDDAIHDGVGVISASFGSPPPLAPFFESSTDIGSFHAVERGVSVVFSCGNGGPSPGVVQNVAPWAISVAASTVDRRFPTGIIIDEKFILTGESLVFQDIIGKLADATTYFNDGICKWENWMKKSASGMIILCFSTLGPVEFIEEAQVAAIRANASALIFADLPTKQLAEEVDIIPTVRINILGGTRIRNYLARSPTPPMVKIRRSKTVIGKITAPSVAYFSSRGPSSLSPDILKPDITAPGIGILAAWPSKTPPTPFSGDIRSVNWNFQSGTSMSCPHVAGVIALLRSAHPDWSPAALRSALMTTAYTRDTSSAHILSGGSLKSSDSFDVGAGHINPLKALDPGLVFDTRTEDYILFLCNIGYTDQQIKSIILPRPKTGSFSCPVTHSYQTNADFNYPSITVPNLQFTTTIRRTVRNVGPNKNAVYFVDIIRPEGVDVLIWPKILMFSRCREENPFYVTFVPKKISTGRYEFGEIIWTDWVHRVRSPLVVFVNNGENRNSLEDHVHLDSRREYL
ncbi:PREDICTED: subtilisin-like protease SBT3.18 [Tarenaya hassleriana]|uniref:subtilisin-like protease SBT3.18 n=1 Tax=Tarenaya hassleriana TaxID=28532 RepID=UPI00053C0D56|nr:PREDICTED: subtilisin-like protease SBT3.18 [Tarenaya hassleriana]